MDVLLQQWLSLFLRWAHIVAAIGWIGSSFYFMWLDASLRKHASLPAGVKGENWSVHGGGFYHSRKYMVAPESMPDDLHWFRWESYLTWLTGFALLSVTYYWSASSYLIDPEKTDLDPRIAVALSVVGLGLGWLLYDGLCKSPLRFKPGLMFAVLFGAIIAATWGYGFIFSDRAVFIQVGATIATFMTGNVFLVIIPNQRVVVADLKAGRIPDARYGEIAKLRSTHNNYLTLPVLFLMMSNHYPMTFGHPFNWAVVGLILALGAVVRHWFNRHEAGAKGVVVIWQWPVAAMLSVMLIALTAWQPGSPPEGKSIAAADALAIVQARCTACHAAQPSHPDFEAPPGGLILETLAHVRANGASILAQSVLSEAMPLANSTGMLDQERAQLGGWIRAGMQDE